MSSDFIFRKAAFGGFNRDDVMSYINNLKISESNLTEAKNNAEKNAEELRIENQELRAKIETVTAEYEAKLTELNICHNQELESIKMEYEEKLQNGILADRSAEEKVGSAMMDVRRYADLLIQETCQKIDKMSDDADTAAAKTLARVLDITSGIQTFSDKLNSILQDMISENENICRELTGFKGTLRIPFETASGKIQADILGE